MTEKLFPTCQVMTQSRTEVGMVFLGSMKFSPNLSLARTEDTDLRSLPVKTVHIQENTTETVFPLRKTLSTKNIVCILQPCFFNHFAATNVSRFSETLSLAENFLSLGRKSLNLAEKFLNLGESGWVLDYKNGILLTKIVIRADLATFSVLSQSKFSENLSFGQNCA